MTNVLPNRIKEILEKVLNQGYTQPVRDLRQDLVDIYQQVLNTTQARQQRRLNVVPAFSLLSSSHILLLRLH